MGNITLYRFGYFCFVACRLYLWDAFICGSSLTWCGFGVVLISIATDVFLLINSIATRVQGSTGGSCPHKC